MSKGQYEGLSRISVDCGPDGWTLRVAGGGEVLTHEMDVDGAVELAASFFLAALCMSDGDPNQLTASFLSLVEAKGAEHEKAQRATKGALS